jgi:hypothetical protein
MYEITDFFVDETNDCIYCTGDRTITSNNVIKFSLSSPPPTGYNSIAETTSVITNLIGSYFDGTYFWLFGSGPSTNIQKLNSSLNNVLGKYINGGMEYYDGSKLVDRWIITRFDWGLTRLVFEEWDFDADGFPGSLLVTHSEITQVANWFSIINF